MKRTLSIILVLAMVLSFGITAMAAEPVVVASPQTVVVNGEEVDIAVYNIDGYNYFRLRDIAILLNGTDSQFSVDFDADSNSATVMNGRGYEGKGELSRRGGKPESCVATTQKFAANGCMLELDVFNIDGYNYFKLRDLGEALRFGVEFDEDNNIAYVEEVDVYDPEYIEYALNLDNMDQKWTYTDGGWVLSVVCAVTAPILEDYEGVSVCVPGAYVKGIDTDGDGEADVAAAEAKGAVEGSLVIDYEAKITSTNGQVYTAATAPLILNTGAAGYGDQGNQSAGTGYVKEGYINIACGNRGKQSQVTDAKGDVLYYTGDAPSCLVDQKAATRFVKYNILLGNIPGNVDYLVSTGGSGGAAHASMFAATSNNPDFYDYQIEVGAVGVYKNEDGTYSTSVTIDGKEVEISDGAWGSIAYSTISSLYEADMTQAFEYYMDTTYEFNSDYEKQLAAYLSEMYMAYINDKQLKDAEGNLLTIEYDLEKYPDTNGYGGTYLDYYLAEFTENLQWYLDNLDYAAGWTWFDEEGNAVESLEGFDKAAAFIEGRYAKAASGGGMGGPGGPGMSLPGGLNMPDIDAIAAATKPMSTDAEKIDWIKANYPTTADISEDEMNQLLTMAEMFAGGGPGGPGMGGSSISYADFDEMSAAWIADVEAVYEGDRFGNNQVYLYNPLNYIGAEGTADPTWAKIIMGAVEGDIAMMNSLNLELAWLAAGTDMTLEWQWDGGHVPSEVLGDSFSLFVDQMYAKHVADAPVKTIEKAAPAAQENGKDAAAAGTDHSSWVTIDAEGKVSFTLADVLAYRNAKSSKAVPGFDVENGGQENYVFGDADTDTRHWNIYIAEIFRDEEKAAVLAPLYNATKDSSAEELPGELPEGGIPGGLPGEFPEGGLPGGLPGELPA